MVQKQEFLKLVQDKVNKDKKGKNKVSMNIIREVCNAIEDVVYDTITKGQHGEYGIHYPNIGKIQTVYCPAKNYYDLNMRKETTKEAHYTVKVVLSNNLVQAPDSYRKENPYC